MKKLIILTLLALSLLLLCGCFEDGAAGKSAYEIAVENGFTGSESEWLASLIGKQGPAGEKGDAGDRGLPGWQGDKGLKGDAGVSITRVYVNEDLHLIVELSEGDPIDAGYVGIDRKDGQGQPEFTEDYVCIAPGDIYLLSANLKSLIWSTSDDSVARVTNGGIIVGISEGSCTVTATSYTGETASCTIYVADFDYKVTADGNIRILSYDGVLSELAIPEKIRDMTVTEIGDWAFFNNKVIEKVTMPDTVTSIDYGAFSCCENLKDVTLSKNLVSLGDSAFSSCYNLGNVELPDTLEYIGGGAFLNCRQMTEVKLPAKITEIGGSSFENCFALTDLDLGNVSIINMYAFNECTSLVKLTLPKSITVIDEYAFSDCTALDELIDNTSDALISETAFDGTKFGKTEPEEPGEQEEPEEPGKIVFEETDLTMYAVSTANVRPDPSFDNSAVAWLKLGDVVNVTGIFIEDEAEGTGWARIMLDGKERYVRLSVLTSENPVKPEEPGEQEEPGENPEGTQESESELEEDIKQDEE